MKATDLAAGDRVQFRQGVGDVPPGVKVIRRDEGSNLYVWCPVTKRRYPVMQFADALGDVIPQLEKI